MMETSSRVAQCPWRSGSKPMAIPWLKGHGDPSPAWINTPGDSHPEVSGTGWGDVKRTRSRRNEADSVHPRVIRLRGMASALASPTFVGGAGVGRYSRQGSGEDHVGR